MTIKNILIIDDHLLFSEGLADILSSVFKDCVVNLINDLDGAFYKIEALSPFLIFLDINLNRYCGLDILKKLREKNCTAKIIMVSVRCDSFTIETAKGLGANGYVMKNESKTNLLYAVNKIINEDVFFTLASNEVKSDSYTLPNGKRVKITKKEMEILHFLCKELCSKEIASKMNISEYTVIGYRKSLFQKFEVKNMIGLVKYGIELGLH